MTKSSVAHSEKKTSEIDSIISGCTEISCLTLKTKEIALDIEGTSLWLDVAKIIKSRQAYACATPALRKFKGDAAKISTYLRNKQTQEYIRELENIFLKVVNPLPLERGFYYKKSGRYGGTWLHRKLYFNFARWCSPRFAILCDHAMEEAILQVDDLKVGREILREIQMPLNDVIKEKLVDTGIKDNSIYMKVAVQLKRFIGAPGERDYCTKLQQHAARMLVSEYRGMILYGGMTSLGEMNKLLIDSPFNLAWRKPPQEVLL